MTTPLALKRRNLLSASEVAEMFGVHRTTVWHWIRRGMLTYEQVTPRFIGVSQDAINTFKKNFGSVSSAEMEPSKSKKTAAKKRR